MAEQRDEAAGGVQVIGAGFGRTGTLSLKFALEKRGDSEPFVRRLAVLLRS